ncbi:hypothetical protein TD95_002693 [Thielaviopsis punctulata]|uniref:Cullin family profile domain-containing protein n=1 Tax=Thielaviopsis punctulata TaxID=72032 RepID=A0A0F4ZHS6_9PEZI|nr:hypothetical protein TD95_002693 [Thielaviopsis punctulata]
MMSGRSTGGGRAAHVKILAPGSLNKAATRRRPDASIDDLWKKVETAIIDIQLQRASLHRFEDIHGFVYKMTVKKHGPLLYDRICKCEIAWFDEHLLPRLRVSVPPDLERFIFDGAGSLNERRQHSQDFLLAVHELWSSHYHAMSMVADVCLYLDRNYSQAQNMPTLFESTIAVFRDHILKVPLHVNSPYTVQQLVLGAIMLQIDMERGGHLINRNAIRGCVRLLCGLVMDERARESQRLYESILEPKLLDESRSFYCAQRQELLSQGSTPSWVKTSMQRLSEETQRCHVYLVPSTLEALIAIVHDELIRAPIKEFINMPSSGLGHMIDTNGFDDIKDLFQLETLVNSDTPEFNAALRGKVVAFGNIIDKTLQETDFSAPKAEGDEPVKATAQNIAAQQTAAAMMWVNKILELDARFSEIVAKCCDGARHVEAAVGRGFSDFINHFDRAAEFVSLYIDEMFRRISRGKEEGDVDKMLDQMIKVVRYIDQKDMFERYYQKHLGRRLMSSKTEVADVERLMVSRMKHEFGNNYTSKFEHMLRDLEISSELTSSYRTHIQNSTETPPAVEITISVLTNGSWPADILGQPKAGTVPDNAPIKSLVWPASLSPAIESVSQFYLQRHNGRKLTWLGSLGSADVVCTFPAIPDKKGPLARERKYEINMPVYGVLVLELFNGVEPGTTRSFEEIQEATAMPPSDLMRTLMALAVAPKCRVLSKTPASKTVRPGDRFAFNAEFVSKTIRIKAPVVTAAPKLENDAQRRETERKNEETRAHLIDAAVVRIMKQRKELGHSPLITEVIKQMAARFNPDVSLVKRRIEDLLARDYIERVEEAETPTYRYLA